MQQHSPCLTEPILCNPHTAGNTPAVSFKTNQKGLIMEIYDNTNPINITKEETENSLSLISQLISSLNFFAVRLKDRPTYNDVATHMGLFESYFSELCKHVPYDSVLQTERENRYKELREANARIEQLQKSAADQVNGETIQAKLSQYADIFTCIYETIGIHYCSLKEITRWGFIYETGDEIQYESIQHLSHTRLSKMPKHILTSHPELDIVKDTYHANILDTDNNKKILTNIFTTWFPGFHVHKFTSHRDSDHFNLRMEISIPFTDLDNLTGTIVTK